MKYKKIVVLIVLIGVLCVAGYYIALIASAVTINPDKLYTVTHVIDGDTFKAKVGSHTVTVRMLGIDTPETVDPRKPVQCYGKEASDETKSLLTDKEVHLKLNPNREEKDKYGRYLAYVYRGDGLFVNEELIKGGFAHEYTYGKKYDFQKEFREVEKVAKDTKTGLWGVCVATSTNTTH